MAQQFSSILVFFQTSSLIEKIKDKKLSRKYSNFSVIAQYDVLFVSYVWNIGNKSIHIHIHCAYMSKYPEILHKKEINIVHKIKIKYQN